MCVFVCVGVYIYFGGVADVVKVKIYREMQKDRQTDVQNRLKHRKDPCFGPCARFDCPKGGFLAGRIWYEAG